MKILILGKYPPIEGGVSTNTYWLARGLAERGHDVHVVTNGDEVEDMFRLSLEADDWPWYEPRFDRSGGGVRVYNPDSFSRRAMGHIPEANPFVSKLAALATDIVRRHRCEVILAYYYEPYAVAGWLASRWTGRPLITKHAGSDLDRLFHVPDLATTYKEVLRSADAVVTQARLMPRFLGMGIRKDRLVSDVPYSVPTAVFCKNAEPLDVDRLALHLRAGGEPQRPRPFEAAVPAIGLYGKIGGSKGTFDLITSLGNLAREEVDFNFLAMVGAAQGEIILPAIREAGLEDRTYILPMLPNWKVPSFIRSCAAACFLERDFPVAIHGPIIPREILACGTCLVLSGEIASKQRYREKLAHGENVLIVNDPRDHAELTDALRSVLVSPGRAASIGEQGASLSSSIEKHDEYIRGWEEVFARCIHDASTDRAGAASPGREVAVPGAVALESTIPDLASFLRRRCPSIVEEFLRLATEGEPRDLAVRFCDFVSERLPREAFAAEAPKVLAAVQYVRARVIATHDARDDHAPPFSVCDRLQGQPVSRESAWELRPVRGNTVRIHEFEYDVSSLFVESSLFGQQPSSDHEPDLESIVPSRTVVLFSRSVNQIPCELRIDGPTRALVEACDGTGTTEELVARMCDHLGAETVGQREALTVGLLGALDRLYRAGVIVFGEQKHGWGWTGGLRSVDGTLVCPTVEGAGE